jgi:hypothetical protein
MNDLTLNLASDIDRRHEAATSSAGEAVSHAIEPGNLANPEEGRWHFRPSDGAMEALDTELVRKAEVRSEVRTETPGKRQQLEIGARVQIGADECHVQHDPNTPFLPEPPLKQHPLSAAFPAMSDEKFEAIRDRVPMLNLALIRTDGGTQSREALNEETYIEYAEAMLAGEKLPPVTVFHDGSTYWLADGFHRFFGAMEAGIDALEADVRQGTQLDAQLFSYGVNGSHGLRRTNADKRRAVTGALKHPVSITWSDNQIASTAVSATSSWGTCAAHFVPNKVRNPPSAPTPPSTAPKP